MSVRLPSSLPSHLPSNASLPELLRSVSIFQGVQDSDLERIAGRMRRMSYKANVPLISQGDEGDRLFILLSGSVHIQRTMPSGRTISLGLRGAGEHFGEMALLDNQKRSADAITATPCDLLILSRDAFQDCVRTHPEIAFAVMTCFAQRLREATADLENRHELDVTGRLAERLLEAAGSEGEQQQNGAIRLSKSRTHQELADMVGTTRESITRALEDLRSLKTIATEGRPTRIVILDEHRLKRRCAR